MIDWKIKYQFKKKKYNILMFIYNEWYWCFWEKIRNKNVVAFKWLFIKYLLQYKLSWKQENSNNLISFHFSLFSFFPKEKMNSFLFAFWFNTTDQLNFHWLYVSLKREKKNRKEKKVQKREKRKHLINWFLSLRFFSWWFDNCCIFWISCDIYFIFHFHSIQINVVVDIFSCSYNENVVLSSNNIISEDVMWNREPFI